MYPFKAWCYWCWLRIVWVDKARDWNVVTKQSTARDVCPLSPHQKHVPSAVRGR